MTTPRNLAAALVIAGLLVAVAACAVGPLAEGSAARPAGPGGGASPCASVYSADRCDALLTMAAESLGVADDAVTAIEIAPDPTPRTDGILETRSGSAGIGVIARVAGATREVQLCMGVAMEPACTLEPRLTIHSAIGNGYEDVPCPGDPPDGCATPVPSPDPGAVTAGRPLRIEHVVLPVTSVGHQELRLGTAILPNGVWTVARADLGDPWPDGVHVSSEGLRLELHSLVPGRPGFVNIHAHGWYPGTEEVEVLPVLDVRRVGPGATIEIRNLLVG